MPELDIKPVNVRMLETATDHAFEALRALHYEIHGAVMGISPGEERWREMLVKIAEINSALYEIAREAETARERELGSEAAQ